MKPVGIAILGHHQSCIKRTIVSPLKLKNQLAVLVDVSLVDMGHACKYCKVC